MSEKQEKILFVPTFNYLSEPIIDRFASMKPDDKDYVCLQVYQPFDNFGVTREHNIFSASYNIYLARKSVIELLRLKTKILRLLEELNPIVIVTFSDITFFAQCLRGTKYEALLLVVQPCLLSPSPPQHYQRFLYTAKRVLNTLLKCNYYRVHHYWGEALERATYLVWSRVELASRTIDGRMYFCGDLFIKDPPSVDLKAADARVLILVPDLPFYNEMQKTVLLESYRKLLLKWPEVNFNFKYHPLNKERLALRTYTNYYELEQFEIETIGSYMVVISAYSNLAVALRRLHQNIVIFDLGDYAANKLPYFHPKFFLLAENTDELLKFFSKLYNGEYTLHDTSYREIFFPVDNECKLYLEQFFDLSAIAGDSDSL